MSKSTERATHTTPAYGAADVMTHYVGDDCPGGHHDDAAAAPPKVVAYRTRMDDGQWCHHSLKVHLPKGWQSHALVLESDALAYAASEYHRGWRDLLDTLGHEQPAPDAVRQEEAEALGIPVDEASSGKAGMLGNDDASSEQAGAGGDNVAAPDASPGLRTGVASPADLVDSLWTVLQGGLEVHRQAAIQSIEADREAIRRACSGEEVPE